jgi:predicted aconitase with swiveling domain
LLLYEPDPILVVGAIVARELYGRTIPVAVCEPGAVPDAAMAALDDGRLTIPT